jgi:hypothetical protein
MPDDQILGGHAGGDSGGYSRGREWETAMSSVAIVQTRDCNIQDILDRSPETRERSFGAHSPEAKLV